MNCTACNSILRYKGGENTKDNGCFNPDCPARNEAMYYGNVSVRPGWYFLESYHLPIKVDGVWYCIEGPAGANRTVLKSIEVIEPILMYYDDLFGAGVPIYNGTRKECRQTYILDIPYMALPCNDDFSREVEVLKERLFSVEKPMQACQMCGEPHLPEDECEEEALMKDEKHQSLSFTIADLYQSDYIADCMCASCQEHRRWLYENCGIIE